MCAKDLFATVPTLLEQGLAGADKASLIGIGIRTRFVWLAMLLW